MTSVKLKDYYTANFTTLTDDEKQAYAFVIPYTTYIESVASTFPVGSDVETAYLDMVVTPDEYQWVADDVLASVVTLKNFTDLIRINGYN